MNKVELLDYLKESEGMEDFDERKIDIYYKRYCELLPRLNAIRVIGGSLAAKALDMQIAVYNSASKPEPTNPDEMVNFDIEFNDDTNINPVEPFEVSCFPDLLPSLSASNMDGYIFICTSESIVEKTSIYMRHLIVAAMCDSTDDIRKVFDEIIEDLHIIEENIKVYGNMLDAMLEAMSNSGSTSCSVYSVKSNPDMKLDVTGLPDGILKIIDSIVESEPDIDPDECLEMAKAYWYEKHGDDDLEDE